MGEAGYILQQEELICLAAFAEGEQLYGVSSTLAHQPRDEILARWRLAKANLADKGYLAEDLDGTLGLDRALMRAVSICCRPRKLLSLGGGGQAPLVYVSQGAGVKLEPLAAQPGTYVLTPFKNQRGLAEMLAEHLTPPAHPYGPPGAAFALERETYEALKRGTALPPGALPPAQGPLPAPGPPPWLRSVTSLALYTGRVEDVTAFTAQGRLWLAAAKAQGPVRCAQADPAGLLQAAADIAAALGYLFQTAALL
jgi:hypothetical protein